MLSDLIRFLKLIRWPNLLVVAVTQYLVFFRVILPAYEQAKLAADGKFDELKKLQDKLDGGK